MTESNLKASFNVDFQFPVVFTEDIFASFDTTLAKLLQANSGCGVRVLPLIEAQLLRFHPELIEKIEQYCQHFDLSYLECAVLPGGEQSKNSLKQVQQIIDLCIEHAIDRHSYIMAIGGGAFLDMAGYAAAIIHRGIRLIRLPTTVLAQNDAGIGVKNAVNYRGQKNVIGTFSPPYAVINDFHFIASLTHRDKRAGIAEAVKVALIKDDNLFHYLYHHRHELAMFEAEPMKYMISQCAKLHLQHICNNGDPFERGSSRPLDFGHWSAHALEEASNFELRHGEAVAIGLLIDAHYCMRKNWLDETSYQKIVNLLLDLGFCFNTPLVTRLDIAQALDNFRIHLGGQLSITMLNGIGDCQEVHELDVDLLTLCTQSLPR